MDLTDAQWAKLDPLFRPQRRSDGRGRPWRDTRAVLNGVLWVLRTGAPWHDLPDSLSTLSNLPSPLSAVAARGAVRAIAANTRRRLARPRQTRSERSLHRRQLQFGEKRGSAVGPTRRGKGSKIMAIADRHGLPVACTWPALRRMKPNSSKPPSQQRFLREPPEANDRRPRLRQRSAGSAPAANTTASS